MTKQIKRVGVAILVGSLCLGSFIYFLYTSVEEAESLYLQQVGMITRGHLDAELENRPFRHIGFLGVRAGEEKSLLNGTVVILIDGHEQIKFRFCEQDCHTGGLVGEPSLDLRPCGAENARIDTSQWRGKTIRLVIDLDEPNATPMAVIFSEGG